MYLLAVISQTGSFTKAAQRLGLSKAAVSNHVTELERVVGIRLAQRTTRMVRLTDAGQQLVEETAEAFAQITHSVDAARDLAGTPRGLVRLTAPVALGRQEIAPLLETFLRQFPDVRVELELSDRLVNLAHEGFDLAVRHTSAPPDNHVAWKLCESRTVLVAAAGYLRRRGVPLHPAELHEHTCLAYLRPGPAAWLFEHQGLFANGVMPEPDRVAVTVQGQMRANNSEVLRAAVTAGLGIAQLPDFSVAAALRQGRLCRVLPSWRPVGFFGEAVYAMRPWSPTTPRAVQVLVAHFRAELAAGFSIAPLDGACDKRR